MSAGYSIKNPNVHTQTEKNCGHKYNSIKWSQKLVVSELITTDSTADVKNLNFQTSGLQVLEAITFNKTLDVREFLPQTTFFLVIPRPAHAKQGRI